MTLPMDNLTEHEMHHLARIANSSESEQRDFRTAVGHLLRCFGDGADASALVLFIDRDQNTLQMTSFGVPLPEAQAVLQLATKQVEGDIAAVLGGTFTDEPKTVQ